MLTFLAMHPFQLQFACNEQSWHSNRLITLKLFRTDNNNALLVLVCVVWVHVDTNSGIPKKFFVEEIVFWFDVAHVHEKSLLPVEQYWQPSWLTFFRTDKKQVLVWCRLPRMGKAYVDTIIRYSQDENLESEVDGLMLTFTFTLLFQFRIADTVQTCHIRRFFSLLHQASIGSPCLPRLLTACSRPVVLQSPVSVGQGSASRLTAWRSTCCGASVQKHQHCCRQTLHTGRVQRP